MGRRGINPELGRKTQKYPEEGGLLELCLGVGEEGCAEEGGC